MAVCLALSEMRRMQDEEHRNPYPSTLQRYPRDLIGWMELCAVGKPDRRPDEADRNGQARLVMLDEEIDVGMIVGRLAGQQRLDLGAV